MGKNTRRKSKAPKREAPALNHISEDDDKLSDQTEVDKETVIAARKLLKRRFYGFDVPSEFWLAFGLENQKRFFSYSWIFSPNQPFFLLLNCIYVH